MRNGKAIWCGVCRRSLPAAAPAFRLPDLLDDLVGASDQDDPSHLTKNKNGNGYQLASLQSWARSSPLPFSPAQLYAQLGVAAIDSTHIPPKIRWEFAMPAKRILLVEDARAFINS
jgi:hypothetical protein